MGERRRRSHPSDCRDSALQLGGVGATLFIAVLSVLVAVDGASAQSSGETLGEFQVEDLGGVQVEKQFSNPNVYEFSELPPGPEVGSKKPSRFRGYSRQKRYFTGLCEALYTDSRAELLSDVGEEFKGGVLGCPACKPFFRLLFSQCGKAPRSFMKLEKDIGNAKRTLALRKKQLAELLEEASPEEGPDEEEVLALEEEIAQREGELTELRAKLPRNQNTPNLVVLDAAVRFSQALVDDEKNLKEHYKAIELLEEELRKEEEKTVAELLYLEVLLPYLKAPFFEFEEKRERILRHTERKRRQREREFLFDSNQIFSGR
ncbi:hypothetical protein MRY87_03135 [bacterium]|nr:hypothetical protein [bacterium]